ncbi:MAG: hypothetical protein ACI9KE_004733 [Polyangiales bacterium]
MVAGESVAKKTKAPAKKAATKTTAPSELPGTARRFKGQRIAFSGRSSTCEKTISWRSSQKRARSLMTSSTTRPRSCSLPSPDRQTTYAPPTPMGPALTALSLAAPTFRNVTIEVTLKSGSKKPKCALYQFDHGTNSSQRQAFFAGEDLEALSLWDAMKRIATLQPDATINEKTLKVKQTKGKTAPSHKPAAFKTLVLEAWQEALA